MATIERGPSEPKLPEDILKAKTTTKPKLCLRKAGLCLKEAKSAESEYFSDPPPTGPSKWSRTTTTSRDTFVLDSDNDFEEVRPTKAKNVRNAHGGKNSKCGCSKYTTQCAICRCLDGNPMKISKEKAVEGVHYTVLNDHVVCKVAPCANAIYKMMNTFRNHVLKHGLISSGTSKSLYALDPAKEELCQKFNVQGRKQPGDKLCYNYYGARGSMRKRWSQAKRRNRATIWAKYITRFEENARQNS